MLEATPPAAGASGGRCPVAHVDLEGGDRAALAGYEALDRLRSASRIYSIAGRPRTHLVTSHEESLRVAQNPEIFPAEDKLSVDGEEILVKLVPETLDGPDHQRWRRLLAPYFSPKAVGSWDDAIRRRAETLIDGLIDRGGCEFTTEFALRYPTAVFLEIMGMPIADLQMLLRWETAILHPDFSPGNDPARAAREAQAGVGQYFTRLMEKRRIMPRWDRPPGLVTEALDWQIDGEPVSDDDILSFYTLMFLAGLDTVTAELGYGFLHLATHPEDRRRIVSDPAIIPRATEELLRLYPVVNISRQIAADTHIAGYPVSRGDSVMVSLPSAGRDEEKYPNALLADFDRAGLSHLTFGAGPHRCLGSHLARHELAIAYEVWHRRIPEYWVEDVAACTETTGGMMTLNKLPLRWK